VRTRLGVEAILREASPGIDIDAELVALDAADSVDVWETYVMLLRPLEKVKQNATFHPEGDALYHSLQVFELAVREREWDLEFVLAALLARRRQRDSIRADHVAAGLEALEGARSQSARAG
jgi:hypothetical protein